LYEISNATWGELVTACHTGGPSAAGWLVKAEPERQRGRDRRWEAPPAGGAESHWQASAADTMETGRQAVTVWCCGGLNRARSGSRRSALGRARRPVAKVVDKRGADSVTLDPCMSGHGPRSFLSDTRDGCIEPVAGTVGRTQKALAASTGAGQSGARGVGL